MIKIKLYNGKEIDFETKEEANKWIQWFSKGMEKLDNAQLVRGFKTY